ncbi:helix-turn-helix transcriptional regulator [Coralloluteibacterium thermophilus]|uniref:Helix-turn-helix transcriptional regulator n=1 Tax=Coralloluteibacterium thermophilum TaxID=2707049 RepID=A0ABV9NLJ4_9GAMM
MERVGLKRTAIYGAIAAGTFPKPVKVGAKSLWVDTEVEAWITRRIAERDVGGNMGSDQAA